MTFSGWPDGGRYLSRPAWPDSLRDARLYNSDNAVSHTAPAAGRWGKSAQRSAGVLWNRVVDPGTAGGFTFQMNTVCWSPELRLFVAGANVTPLYLAYSTNGRNWLPATGAGGVSCYSICWSRELSMFVATFNGRMGYSYNGINFTTTSIINIWRSVCWSPQLGIFVAVASDIGSANQVIYSTDGINWTNATAAAANQWLSVCWAAELGIFCAVAGSGTGNRVMTSPDGINWTAQASAADSSWPSVCWSPELRLFVAVSNFGTTKAMTSSDGINWQAITTGLGTQNYRSVCWISDLGIFVTASPSDAISPNRITTSSDGINWIQRNAPLLNYTGVCWAPELATTVAVSFDSGIAVSQ